MKKPLIFAAVLAASTVFAPAATAQSSQILGEVRGWKVGLDVEQAGCFALGEFEDGLALKFGFDAVSGKLDLLLGSRRWASIQSGHTYDVAIQFGKREPWLAAAQGGKMRDGRRVLKTFSANPRLVKQFMKAYQMKVFYAGREIARLSLAGSFAAFDEVMKCQEKVYQALDRGRDPFSDGKRRRAPAARLPAVNVSDPFSI